MSLSCRSLGSQLGSASSAGAMSTCSPCSPSGSSSSHVHCGKLRLLLSGVTDRVTSLRTCFGRVLSSPHSDASSTLRQTHFCKSSSV
eukprot:3291112-Amphidinium_carterae.1